MGKNEAEAKEVKTNPIGLWGLLAWSLLDDEPCVVLELALFDGTNFLPNIFYKYPTRLHVHASFRPKIQGCSEMTWTMPDGLKPDDGVAGDWDWNTEQNCSGNTGNTFSTLFFLFPTLSIPEMQL